MRNIFSDIVASDSMPASSSGVSLHAKIYNGVSFAREKRKKNLPFTLRGVGPIIEPMTWLVVSGSVNRNVARLEVEHAFDQAVRKQAGHLTDEAPSMSAILKAIVPYRAECLNYVQAIINDAFSRPNKEMILRLGSITPGQASAVQLNGNAYRAVEINFMLDVLDQIPGRRAHDLAMQLTTNLESVKEIFGAEYGRAKVMAADKYAVLGPSTNEDAAYYFRP